MNTQDVRIKDPTSKLVRHAVILSIALFVVTSILPAHILETGFTAEYFGNDSDVLDEGDLAEEFPYVINDEGYILKPSPVTEDADRTGMTGVVIHTVAPGDTLSGIANLYGVAVSTLVWENNISENAALRVGQQLTIPALDGITHTIAEKDTVAGIAKLYGIDEKIIRDHNKLEGDVLTKGEKMFIPGAKRKSDPAAIARAGTRSTSGRKANTFDPKVIIASDSAPKGDKPFIKPTSGDIMQYFKAGHYAQDIASRSKPDVWAAGAGTVVTSKGGCLPRDVQVDRRCNGGYGNYVVIDHGDGLQTLYAHLETIYVSEGDWLPSGQALGKMGNSGRTYGATGIHLHFEVYVDGKKENPAKYY